MNKAGTGWQRGEIWVVNLNPTIGTELQKTRPALIISESAIAKHLLMRTIIPITGWNRTYEGWPWMTKIPKSVKNGLTKDSAADASQIRAVSVQRLSSRVGVVTPKQLEEIVASVVLYIGYECPICSKDAGGY